MHRTVAVKGTWPNTVLYYREIDFPSGNRELTLEISVIEHRQADIDGVYDRQGPGIDGGRWAGVQSSGSPDAI